MVHCLRHCNCVLTVSSTTSSEFVDRCCDKNCFCRKSRHQPACEFITEKNYAILKKICKKIFKQYNRCQNYEKYAVYEGGNSINIRIQRADKSGLNGGKNYNDYNDRKNVEEGKLRIDAKLRKIVSHQNSKSVAAEREANYKTKNKKDRRNRQREKERTDARVSTTRDHQNNESDVVEKAANYKTKNDGKREMPRINPKLSTIEGPQNKEHDLQNKKKKYKNKNKKQKDSRNAEESVAIGYGTEVVKQKQEKPQQRTEKKIHQDNVNKNFSENKANQRNINQMQQSNNLEANESLRGTFSKVKQNLKKTGDQKTDQNSKGKETLTKNVVEQKNENTKRSAKAQVRRQEQAKILERMQPITRKTTQKYRENLNENVLASMETRNDKTRSKNENQQENFIIKNLGRKVRRGEAAIGFGNESQQNKLKIRRQKETMTFNENFNPNKIGKAKKFLQQETTAFSTESNQNKTRKAKFVKRKETIAFSNESSLNKTNKPRIFRPKSLQHFSSRKVQTSRADAAKACDYLRAQMEQRELCQICCGQQFMPYMCHTTLCLPSCPNTVMSCVPLTCVNVKYNE